MLLRYFYDDTLAQASYLVGCAVTGEALVIDPARDVTPYLETANAEGLRITHITETHIHADFVSGSRELAHRSGGRLYLSDMGDAAWKYGFADDGTILLHDGDSWMVGNIKVEVLHTPGHTPEHLAFQITDTAGADAPIGIFTGDCIFVGTMGRPDLLEEAAGIADTRELGARQQFQNMQRFRAMPDYLQLLPGHGAGSACGKSLGALPSTTLGYEKLFNPAFQFEDEDRFVDWLLADQPEAPRYFGQMKRVNKDGVALLSHLPTPQLLPPDALPDAIENGLVIDTRSGADFAANYVPNTLHIPASSRKFSSYAGWFIDYDKPLTLIADESAVGRLTDELRAIGADNLMGYFLPQDVLGDQFASIPQMDVQELQHRLSKNDIQVIDVRGATEYQDGNIAQSVNIPLGYLPRHLQDLPHDKTLVVHCQTGVRSQIAASLLRQNGFADILNLQGGIAAWQDAGLPTE